MSRARYISTAEIEKTASPWDLVRLRLREHELTLVASRGSPAAFTTRNALFRAIALYARSPGVA